jgi:flagellar L-ring protein precursor FlgH
MKLLLFTMLFIISSCATYVESMHRKISYEENKSKAGYGWPYPKNNSKEFDKRPIKDPLTYSVSGEQNTPPTGEFRKRYTAKDFIDNQSSGSLWANYNGNSSLFEQQNNRNLGDVVVINVLEALKGDISRELKRNSPTVAPIVDDQAARNVASQAPADGEKSKPKADKNSSEEALIVYDKIPTTLFSDIGNDHAIIKGTKEVYFRNEKKLIEIQAMIRKSDIDEADSVFSDKIIESRIKVVR